MYTVIFAVSKKGFEAALDIADGLTGVYGEDISEIQVYIKSKYIRDLSSIKTVGNTYGINVLKDNEDMSECAHRAFYEADALIFVCACGIAVRMIAPCVNDKALDPAVLVIDEGLNHCIPILSGHLGGANELALKLADVIKAVPVITTASDGRGLKAVDSFAIENKLAISDLKKAKDHTAALLNGEKIYVINEIGSGGISNELPEGYEYCNDDDMIRDETPDISRFIRIAYKDPQKDADTAGKMNVLTLIPQCLRVGIGCRRGISREQIGAAVDACFLRHGLYREAIKEVCSIDIKADEEGLLDYCNDAGLPITFYSAEHLRRIEGDFEGSDFVNEVTGVDNVCERSALVKGGQLLVSKEKYEGVTVAVAVCGDE